MHGEPTGLFDKANGKKESRSSLSPKSGQTVLFHFPLHVFLNEQTLKGHHTISVVTEVSAASMSMGFCTRKLRLTWGVQGGLLGMGFPSP